MAEAVVSGLIEKDPPVKTQIDQSLGYAVETRK
jgi:hypothetical protein